jgi:hypothetical protein
MSSIYDENFYKLYLEHEYPTTKLWKQTSYKELCAKSLTEGVICKKNKKILPISGIKAQRSHYGFLFVLTFNGDLCAIDKTKNLVLLSNNVVDFDCETYITCDEWYFIKKDLTSHLIMRSSTAFKFVVSSLNISCATTQYNVYVFKFKYGQKMPTKVASQQQFNNKINKMVMAEGDIVLLFSDGHLLILGDNLNIKAEVSDVSELYPQIFKCSGRYYLCEAQSSKERAKEHANNGIFLKNKGYFIAKQLELKSIKNVVGTFSRNVLSNDTVYSCIGDLSSAFPEKSHFKRNKIKNINGDETCLYLILSKDQHKI